MSSYAKRIGGLKGAIRWISYRAPDVFGIRDISGNIRVRQCRGVWRFPHGVKQEFYDRLEIRINIEFR